MRPATLYNEARVARGTDGAQRDVFRNVIRRALDAGIPFAVGGFHALAAHTGQKRKSKDLDLYVVPSDHKRMIGATVEAGLSDYYGVAPYDRRWIYRSHRDGVIVDVIWAMANYRAEVDRVWLEAGPEIHVAGFRLRALPAEEALWTRLYVLQRDRCDWPDILNLLAAAGPGMDWKRLAERLGEDLPLLAAVMGVFAWLDPWRAARLPACAWRLLRHAAPLKPSEAPPVRRSVLLDARRWYVGGSPPKGRLN